jgi:hypothetical protein
MAMMLFPNADKGVPNGSFPQPSYFATAVLAIANQA